MSGEISQTSMFLSRLANLRQSQATSVKNTSDDKSAAPAQTTQNSSSTSEPVTIVVTSLNEKVQDLQKLLDGIDKNITTLSNSRDLADKAVATMEEAGGITVRARDTLKTASGYEGNKDRISELQDRYTAALEKLAQIVDSASTDGVNLLKGDTLTTSFDQTGKSTFTTTGMDLSPETLEFRNPDFTTLEGVQNSRIDVMNAVDIGTTLRHILSSDMILMQTRQEFSQETISTLSAGAEQIPVAHLGDESANLLALQVRQQLSESDVPLASEGQQYLLKQF